jgi:hypothetical protein
MIRERLRHDKKDPFAVRVADRIVVNGIESRDHCCTVGLARVVDEKVAVVEEVRMKCQTK